MKYYEGMFLISLKNLPSEEAAESAVKEVLTKHGAEVKDLKKWDEKRLAYQIGPHKRGLYLLTHFEAPPGSIASIKRECQLSGRIIRVLILAKEEPKEEASPVEEAPQAETPEEEKEIPEASS